MTNFSVFLSTASISSQSLYNIATWWCFCVSSVEECYLNFTLRTWTEDAMYFWSVSSGIYETFSQVISMLGKQGYGVLGSYSVKASEKWRSELVYVIPPTNVYHVSPHRVSNELVSYPYRFKAPPALPFHMKI